MDNEQYCHYLVEYALPVEKETPCMRFMEDVSLRYGVYTGNDNAWNQNFTSNKIVRNAFMEQCDYENQIRKKISNETLACVEKLRIISDLPRENAKIPTLCRMMGFPLTETSLKENSFLVHTTHR